jgi:Uma2 family endonuclease
MATVSSARLRRFEYPTSDGKPMAETDFHRDLMVELIDTLDNRFAAAPRVYVSGNLLVFYEPGNKRKHVSPDVFVVRGVPKKKRPYYLTWEEGRMPSFVIELTSKSTRHEDKKTNFALYRDVLKVKEYFLFDPFADYLKPRLQGYRLRKSAYVPVTPVAGRRPSQAIGLHLEPVGRELRLYDPETGEWLPTSRERTEQEKNRADRAETQLGQETARANEEKARADRAETQVGQEKARAAQAEREKVTLAEENERQRQLLDKLLRNKKNGR